MKPTIVIPVFNEKRVLRVVLRNVLDARPEIGKGSPFESVELLVVDDGSSDRKNVSYHRSAIRASYTLVMVLEEATLDRFDDMWSGLLVESA